MPRKRGPIPEYPDRLWEPKQPGETQKTYLARLNAAYYRKHYWKMKKYKDHVHYCRPGYHQKFYQGHYWIHDDSPHCYYNEEDHWSKLYIQCEEHKHVKKYPRKPKFYRPVKFPRL